MYIFITYLESILLKYKLNNLIIMNFSIFSYIQFIYSYLFELIKEYIDYWYVYVILCFPAYLFYNKKLVIISDDDSLRNLWFLSIRLIFKNDKDNSYYSSNISGYQLLLVSDIDGKISINKLLSFYPNLNTIELRYLDLDQLEQLSKLIEVNTNNHLPITIDLSLGLITQIIDIEKKMDIRNNKKCKFGYIQL